MDNTMLRYINATVLRDAGRLIYTVADVAPSNETDLFNSPSLVIWSGASDKTIYGDATVNYAFRAIHDALHLETGLGFSVEHEIEMGRIQASRQSSSLMAELVYCEVSMQAAHYGTTGQFVQDQVGFTMSHLEKMGFFRK